MVGFGKSIVKAQRDGWSDAYLDYEKLKDIVNEIELLLRERKSSTFGDAFACKKKTLEFLEEGQPKIEDLEALKDSFHSELKSEIEKLSLFILQQQGRLADAVGALRFKSPLFDQKSSLLHQNTTKKDISALDTDNTLDQYAVLGVELLHLLKFVCVNSIGVRKILKKYNKCFERLDETHKYEVTGDHLQQLAYSPSIRAIESSLKSAVTECYANLPSSTGRDPTAALLRVNRFQCVMSCNDKLRSNAEILQQPFWDYLSRKAMILTGADLGGMEGSGRKALKWLIRLRPENLLTMTDEQLGRLWSRWSGGPNAAGVQKQGRSASKRILLQSIREEENDNLEKEDLIDLDHSGWTWGGVNSASMTLNLLSTLLYTINYYIVAPTANHYAIKLGADGAFGSTLIGASSFSALFAAFFYSFWYTKASFKSALIFSALCPVIGNLVYALAISYNSMKMAFCGRILCGFGSAEVVNRQLISACVNFEGMTKASALFVAAGAIGMSVGPLLAGILDLATGRDANVDFRWPLFPAGGIIYDHVTSPGFLMAGLWMFELFALVFFFVEPHRINGGGGLEESTGCSSTGKSTADRSTITDRSTFDRSSTDRSTAAGSNSGSFSGDSDDEGSGAKPFLVDTNGYGSIPPIEKRQKAKPAKTFWQEIFTTSKLVFQNPGVPVTVLLFGYIEMVDEVLISSCSMVVRRYFGWSASVAGFLIAGLGALVLPAHFVVEKASHYYSERNIMSKSLVFLVLSLLGILNWSALLWDFIAAITGDDWDTLTSEDYANVYIGGQELGNLLTDKGEFEYDFGAGPVVYIVFLSAVFMGTIVLEGVDTSIMAKTTPAELNDRFVNCGLLATLVGTLGRVVADGMITFSALYDVHVLCDFVNATFIPLLVLTLMGLYMCRKYYRRLV